MAAASDRRRAHAPMPAELVKEIDALVGRRRRSRFLEEAAVEKAQVQRRVAAVARALAVPAIGVPAWDTAESAAVWARDVREEWGERLSGVHGADSR